MKREEGYKIAKDHNQKNHPGEPSSIACTIPATVSVFFDDEGEFSGAGDTDAVNLEDMIVYMECLECHQTWEWNN